MTYCYRDFKAAQINVWFGEAMPGKEWAVPRLRIQSVMWNDAKLLVVWGMCRGEARDGGQDGWLVTLRQWHVMLSNCKKKLRWGTVLKMQPELRIKLFSTLVYSRRLLSSVPAGHHPQLSACSVSWFSSSLPLCSSQRTNPRENKETCKTIIILDSIGLFIKVVHT